MNVKGITKKYEKTFADIIYAYRGVRGLSFLAQARRKRPSRMVDELKTFSDKSVVQAREIRYGIRVEIHPRRKNSDLIYYFPINKNTINGDDDLSREFIKRYNEENGTNFNALVNYSLKSPYGGWANSKGTLNGALRGTLLEIK